ncbi:ImmA/IrrE family metallo-endopeptidase [Aurantimonas coralicida]|uniref:ImmA/IrrE family metallo-endopeptidase n=1 Tax=Aurantimonas coralicida TaxID=182270 RepID=UPI00238A77A2|nr:ImmA/IrrE family metallo-endopeptidase [Aurantimonas coralicida]MDE0921500.1 ImmA/IrrE family metallo-endopeptidase [Aurantimonas coralicida]
MTNIPKQTMSRIADLLEVAPVDVGAVAARLGLAIFERSLPEGVSGMIQKDASYDTPSGYVIFVDDGEAFVRQRFTAAHEIGHHELHRNHIGDGLTENYLLRSDQLSNWIEVQANRFAADLLMPLPLIETLTTQGYTSVPELARKLQVSEIAMGIRLGHPT